MGKLFFVYVLSNDLEYISFLTTSPLSYVSRLGVGNEGARRQRVFVDPDRPSALHFPENEIPLRFQMDTDSQTGLEMQNDTLTLKMPETNNVTAARTTEKRQVKNIQAGSSSNESPVMKKSRIEKKNSSSLGRSSNVSSGHSANVSRPNAPPSQIMKRRQQQVRPPPSARRPSIGSKLPVDLLHPQIPLNGLEPPTKTPPASPRRNPTATDPAGLSPLRAVQQVANDAGVEQREEKEIGDDYLQERSTDLAAQGTVKQRKAAKKLGTKALQASNKRFKLLATVFIIIVIFSSLQLLQKNSKIDSGSTFSPHNDDKLSSGYVGELQAGTDESADSINSGPSPSRPSPHEVPQDDTNGRNPYLTDGDIIEEEEASEDAEDDGLGDKRSDGTSSDHRVEKPQVGTDESAGDTEIAGDKDVEQGSTNNEHPGAEKEEKDIEQEGDILVDAVTPVGSTANDASIDDDDDDDTDATDKEAASGSSPNAHKKVSNEESGQGSSLKAFLGLLKVLRLHRLTLGVILVAIVFSVVFAALAHWKGVIDLPRDIVDLMTSLLSLALDRYEAEGGVDADDDEEETTTNEAASEVLTEEQMKSQACIGELDLFGSK